MKLNKPTVTENQSELESYVEGLLKDSHPPVNDIANKVTPLRSADRPVSEDIIESQQVELVKKAPLSIAPEQPKTNRPESNRASAEAEHKETITGSAKLAQSGQKTSLETSYKGSKRVSLEDNKAEVSAAKLAIESTHRQQNTSLPLANNKNDRHHERLVAKEFGEYRQSEFSVDFEQDPRLKNVEKLLNRIALASAVVSSDEAENISNQVVTPTDAKVIKPLVEESTDVSSETVQATFSHREGKPLKELLGGVFQTLVFEVNKLPLAVPLLKLGGIVKLNVEEVTPLVGTPDWFLGLLPNERGNLMVVDTQRFLMPEKPASEIKTYQYLIVLDDSKWALACHAVNDAKNLSPEDIRWSARSSKRPWFAGMVVEYMSALIEVDELINMLAENITD